MPGRREAVTAILFLAASALVACGGPREPQAPKLVLPPLKLDPLGEIVPAAGLEYLVTVEPKVIANAPETTLALAEMLPPARFAAFAQRHGAELRSLDEVAVAGYPETTLVVARGFLDPNRVEAAFAKRTMVDERLVDSGGIVHLAARGLAGPERLVVMGPLAAGTERGKAGPLRAAEMFALGKLKRARPALASEPLAGAAKVLGKFPARVFFPGPFAEEWAHAAGGLLRTATAAAVGARPLAGPEPGARIEVILIVAGTWSEAEGAKARLGAALDRLLASDIGRLLGTDHLAEPLRVDFVEGDPSALRARAVLVAKTFFKGLHDATEATAGEIFRK